MTSSEADKNSVNLPSSTQDSTTSSLVTQIPEPDKEDNSTMPPINIFNKLILHKKNPVTKKIYKDGYIYIVGKLSGHTTLARYNFPAVNFDLFIPSEKKLYQSIMNSDKCYSSSFKWTYHYFKQVRECLTSSSDRHDKEKKLEDKNNELNLENKNEDKNKMDENKENIDENKRNLDINNESNDIRTDSGDKNNESNDIRTDSVNKTNENNDIKTDEEKNKENIDTNNVKSEEVINGDKVINVDKKIENENNKIIEYNNDKRNDNESKKRYYFIINNPLEGANKNDYMETNLSKVFLELHFLGKDKDVIAFKLLLDDNVKLDPYYYFINKITQIDNAEEKSLLEKERKKHQQIKEIFELNNSIIEMEAKSKLEMKENFIKFYLLNRTKIEKKYELEHEFEEKKKEIHMLDTYYK